MTKEKLALLLKNLGLTADYIDSIPKQSELAKDNPTKRGVK